MVVFTTILLFSSTFAVAIQGNLLATITVGIISDCTKPSSVIPQAKECSGLLWNVVGRHYVPQEKCLMTTLDATEASILREEYLKILSADQSDVDSQKINEILDQMMVLLPNYSSKNLIQSLECTACKAGIETYTFLISTGFKRETILKILEQTCIDFHVMTPKICKGTLDMYGETLMTIINQTNSSSGAICSVLLNLNCGGKVSELKWNVTLPNTKKPPIKKPTPLPDTVRNLKVLHISDTHWDTQYEVGSWAECNLPLCCRKENVLPNKNETKAGKFGGWRCDTPEATFDDMLRHIAKQHPDLDYIIWTGDIPAHNIWEQTKAENLDVLNKTVAKLIATFPKTPIFPALGNHESVPSNMFPTSSNNESNLMDWLYDKVNEQWQHWLPKNLSKTIRMGAFYTIMIRPGLRLVSMNMNYCYKMNWWLAKNSKDPMNELQWLVTLLQEAEKIDEKVHIIGHVPPGSNECIKTWQTNYYNILNRFEKIVTAQFFGHTHSDEFEVFYDMKNNSRPFGVAYIGPSLTTYMYHNPSYRIYYVEGDHPNSNRFVVDHESWYFELEKANKLNKTEWKKLYSAKNAYNMTSLYPDDWHNLYLKIKKSDQILQLYHKYYWNDSPKRPKCDRNCLIKRLCEIRSCDQYGYPEGL